MMLPAVLTCTAMYAIVHKDSGAKHDRFVHCSINHAAIGCVVVTTHNIDIDITTDSDGFVVGTHEDDHERVCERNSANAHVDNKCTLHNALRSVFGAIVYFQIRSIEQIQRR